MTRTMKDSGIEWIGEIPIDWETIRTKNTATLFNGNSIKDDEKSQYEDSTDAIPYISTKDIDSLHNIDYCNGMYVKNDDPNFKVAHKNSTLMCIEGGSAGIKKAKLNQDVCFVNKLCCFEPKSINSDYLYYFLNNPKYEDHFKSLMSGLIGGVSISDLKNINCTLPPLFEQQKIAAFLDEKCGEIDEIISKTEQSIEEYKKLKQSVITKAVTKSIRSARPMKDSNIDWIGKIPADWEIKKFRNILKERTEKNVPIKSTERLSLSIDLGVTLYAEKTTNLDRFKDDFEQYKIAHKGDLVMNSMNMIIGAVGVSKYYGCVSPVYYTWYDETPEHTTARYCEYLLRCKTIKKVLFSLGRGIYAIERGDDRVNTCRLKISRDDLKNLKLPLPSLEEQKDIISYIDNKCIEIDALIAKKQQFLTEMANYKKSLIYEYVTGKKEVA